VTVGEMQNTGTVGAILVIAPFAFVDFSGRSEKWMIYCLATDTAAASLRIQPPAIAPFPATASSGIPGPA